MTTSIDNPTTPTAADANMARESVGRLSRHFLAKTKKSVQVRIGSGADSEEPVSIPGSAFRLLGEILSEMAKGNAVSLVPVRAELTTQQAADLIDVSRPFLIEQLDKGELPFRKVGSHRRVRFDDLMAYKQTMMRNRLDALEKLSALDQELGLGY